MLDTCHYCCTIWLQAWSNGFMSVHDNPFSFRLRIIRRTEIFFSVQLGGFVLLVVILYSVRGMSWEGVLLIVCECLYKII